MADPFAGFRDAGPQAPVAAPQADPWAGFTDAGPGAADQAPTFAERSAGAFDRSSYRPTSMGDLMRTGEVPKPGERGGNYSSDITQRARNTALGQGPGSAEVAGRGVPGIALPAALEGTIIAAPWLAKGAVSAAKQLPGTALAATAGYVASHFEDQPAWMKEFVHNLLLHFQLGAGGKK